MKKPFSPDPMTSFLSLVALTYPWVWLANTVFALVIRAETFLLALFQ